MLGHALRVLEALENGSIELSLQEISSRAKISNSSAFRILFTLESQGYLTKIAATRRYRLGPQIQEMSRRGREGRGILQVVHPHMEQLHDHFRETVNLAAFQNGDFYYLDIIESSHPFRMTAQVGWRTPFHASAVGKVIAAYLPDPELKALIKKDRLPRLTPNTITNRASLLKLLAAIPEQGYSVDDEEVELGASCVAVPLVAKGQVNHALSISGPTHRIHTKRRAIIRELKRAAAAIELEMTV